MFLVIFASGSVKGFKGVTMQKLYCQVVISSDSSEFQKSNIILPIKNQFQFVLFVHGATVCPIIVNQIIRRFRYDQKLTVVQSTCLK